MPPERRELQSERAEEREEPAVAAPAPTPAAEVLRLQQTAGNAAVSRAMVARQGMPSFVKAPSLAPGIGGTIPGLKPIMPEPLAPAVEKAVKTWVQTHHTAIWDKAQRGETSMPEVVAEIRKDVPEAADAKPGSLEPVVSEVMGRETPPPTRTKQTAVGMEAELLAKIANSLPKVPKSIGFSTRAGKLELTLEGLEYSTKVGGTDVSVQGNTGEGEASVKKGDVKVSGTASYKGDSFGLKTQVGDVTFEGKVEKEGGTFSKASLRLGVTLLGDSSGSVPAAAEIKAAVEGAHAAVGEVIAHVQGGGSPTDDVVKKKLEAIKPAFDAVSKATTKSKGPSVSVGVKGEGGAGGWSAGVSLVITF